MSSTRARRPYAKRSKTGRSVKDDAAVRVLADGGSGAEACVASGWSLASIYRRKLHERAEAIRSKGGGPTRGGA